MNIPKKQLDDSINGIVDFFQRNSRSATNKADFQKIQDTSVANLDGIYFLFLENLEIGRQITQAKITVLDEKFIPKKIINELHHHIECLDEHCLGECLQPACSNKKLYKMSLKTGGACLPPVQSSDAVGQGGTSELSNEHQGGYTIACADCHGTGIDSLDMCLCDNCRGTGREYIATNNHAIVCKCSDCLPYGPGEEPVLKIQKLAVIL